MTQKTFRRARATVALALAASVVSTHAATEQMMPEYVPEHAITGKLTSVGSDTLNNLMTFWTEAYRQYHPRVDTEVQGAGSSTAPPALVEGVSNLGPMSRHMKGREIRAFVARHGYEPTAIPVAVDALAIFVNRRNTIAGLSLQEVDAIFSSTRRCGAARKIRRWGDIESTPVAGNLRRRTIQTYGRNSVSGTYGYFKKVALCKGDYLTTVIEQPGSSAVVQSVGKSRQSIGYSGIGYRTSQVRALPLSRQPGGPLVAATAENAAAGTYPLSRYLYIYVNKPPGQPLARKEREFLTMVLSRQGQAAVNKAGYVPLPVPIVRQALALLDAN